MYAPGQLHLFLHRHIFWQKFECFGIKLAGDQDDAASADLGVKRIVVQLVATLEPSCWMRISPLNISTSSATVGDEVEIFKGATSEPLLVNHLPWRPQGSYGCDRDLGEPLLQTLDHIFHFSELKETVHGCHVGIINLRLPCLN